jgi:uncharacterized MAPEG superfamily protein
MNDVTCVVLTVLLAWVMIITAANIRNRGSLKVAVGNRDDVPPPTPLSTRADRASGNMLENLVLFLGLWMAARVAGGDPWKVDLGCQIFLGARALYWPVFLAGVKVVRTAIWGAGVAGMGLLAYAALSSS